MNNFNYCLYQLGFIKKDDENVALVKVKGCIEGETNWMSLNKESAKTLIEWLTENYLGDTE